MQKLYDCSYGGPDSLVHIKYQNVDIKGQPKGKNSLMYCLLSISHNNIIIYSH